MSIDPLEFQTVTFDKERDRVFGDLAARPVLLSAWVMGEPPVSCHVTEVRSTEIALQLVSGDGRGARVGASVELLFSLDEGQYHLATTLTKVNEDRWEVSRAGQLGKLQRRNNFRATVPHGARIVFKLASIGTNTIKMDVPIVDLSAGGMRLHWPATGVPPLRETEALSGTVWTPGRSVEVFGKVKTFIPDDRGARVGVEFQNVSGKDEQSLLFLCLQLRRQSEPVNR
ncbi:MAG: PilZ domain-containing protein [Bdellovibrionota bacterium]